MNEEKAQLVNNSVRNLNTPTNNYNNHFKNGELNHTTKTRPSMRFVQLREYVIFAFLLYQVLGNVFSSISR